MADGRSAVGLQRFFDASAAGESGAARESKGARRARPHAEGGLLRFPIVLGGAADGAYLRAFVADAMGNEGESKMVKVYSNCLSAELFLDGVSCGVKTRNSQDFPAAGLRWMVNFEEGNNRIRVVARKGTAEVSDQITVFYQTRKFGKPTHFELSQSKAGGLIQIEAWLMDTGGILCVEARNAVRFELAGDGLLIDNLGTARGSRKVELCNGRAYINVNPRGGKNVVSISAARLPTAFINVG